MLQHTLSQVKQEREVAKYEHEKELREVQVKVEVERRRAQVSGWPC